VGGATGESWAVLAPASTRQATTWVDPFQDAQTSVVEAVRWTATAGRVSGSPRQGNR
jgi:hypothetical protein